MEMKTTAVRKLLPDQWGFLCPVHTPDGGPCGLLSHLSLKCSVLAYPADDGADKLDELLVSLGVIPAGAGQSDDGRLLSSYNHLPVCLDGRVVGDASTNTCKTIAAALRQMKVSEKPRVPPTLEVAFIPSGKKEMFSLLCASIIRIILTSFFPIVTLRKHWRTLPWTFSLYRCRETCSSSDPSSDRWHGNDWTNGATVYGYRVS